MLGLISAVLLGLSANAQAQCANAANPVVAENCLTGNPSSEWDIDNGDAGDPTIQGFSTDISVNQGGTVYFKISTPAAAYKINIYRLGYYGGMGARKVATITPSASLPQTQPACISDSTTGLTDCGNWAISASWTVPSTAVSGVYVAHLVRSDTGGDSHIVFIVRNDTSHSDIVYQTSDPTWQAYNYYGNGSLYGPGQPYFSLPARTFVVSYNRPVLTRGFSAESATWIFGAEFAMIQWLEQNGYDVSYISGVDTARSGTLIQNHKVFMDSGHDEYVSAEARASMQSARDAGVNMAFFSGNEIFWKTRWQNSSDTTNTPYRTIVCYKETLAFAKLDPQDPPTWTGTWRDPTFSPPADGGKPENALTGTIFAVNGSADDNPGNFSILVPAEDGRMRFWRNTAAATQAPGATLTLAPGTLGYEWDIDADNGSRPPGAFRLSTSSYTLVTDLLLDYGGTYGAGTATHHLMMYRAPSGALVFGAGTIDWAYGLSTNHDNSFNIPNLVTDSNVQQATVNLFADMGVQPATLQSGLTKATKSTDTVPPQSTILTPAVGANLSAGGTVTITGTASDTNGLVAGVEVSGDGGVTWHPATGRSNWTYAWTPNTTGSITLLSRAVDDSGNIETPSAGVIVGVSPQTCPCTIFGASQPATADSGDGSSVEVGVKFRADSDGSIVGVRFYKSTANVGTHIGHVWTSTGQLLGTATFSAETASGWQQANFSSPIAASANTTYVVSYFAPSGHYSADSFFFEQSGLDNPPLHALANGVDGGNGLFIYPSGSTGGFPVSTFNATNYWVDVIYSSSNTYSITGNISGPGGVGATVSLSGPEVLSTSSDSSGNFSFGGVVNGSYTVSVSNPGVTFTPASQTVNVGFGSVAGVNFVAAATNPLSISGTITGGAGALVTLAGATNATTTADSGGNYSFGGLLNGAYTVTPSEASYIFLPSTQAVSLSGSSVANLNFQGQVCTCISIWQSTDVPATIDTGDGTAVEVGVRFTADSPAYLTGLRFYKASTNTGTHVGHLWSSSGQLLATATFPGETASGWQQGYFSSPVLVNAGTPYVASYFAPNGHYSATSGYFASSGKDNPPLHALTDGANGANGIYIYSATGGFPTSTFDSTNYWVDVLYDAVPHQISGTISGPGGAGATVTLSGTSQASTTADGSGNFTFSGIYSGSYSITPSDPGSVFVPGNQNVTVSQTDLTGVNFTVPSICPCNTVWQPSTVPSLVDSNDNQSVELGTKVRTDSDGYVLGVRFYKSPANTGSHIGNLWSTQGTGTLLSSAPFTNESISGWQQVIFNSPVPVQANTTYVASYFAPMGHYSADASYFASKGIDSPPVHALESGVDGLNGVFAYGASSSYPMDSFNADNYWVDFIYATASTYTIAGNISGPGAANATIALSGPTSATTTTDSNGNYSFNGVANGSYTVTASESGFVFTPSTLTLTISGAHNLSANFSSAILGYSVSGTVSGAPGITVTLSGGSTTQTTVADASGNYLFTTVPSGTYTVTPAGAGFAVSPLNQSISVSNSAITNVNFSAVVTLFSVSGTITGGAGSTVSLSGNATATTVADASGNYTFTGVTVGNYLVTPATTPGVVFSPAGISVSVAGVNLSGVNFSVPSGCPCDTIWNSSATPGLADSGDPNAVEVGVKFRADADAYITGVRFYKSSANTGTHLGRIWTSSGTLLGSATFVNESATGWQQVLFSSPIPVSANTTYVASYFAPSGRYAFDMSYFSTAGVDTPPLHALANGVDGPNGVYAYSSVGGFPSLDFENNAVNYWVDVVYTPSTTYSVTGSISGPGGAAATLSLSGTSSATATADASGNFSFNGLANGSYVVTPSESGYAYTPASQNATISNGHFLGLSFSSAASVHTLTGVISGPGGPGATVALSGPSTATVTADGTGTYSFPGLVDGAYTVSVSGAGFVFTPASQNVTMAGANLAANFSSVAQTFSLSGSISGPGGAGATVTLSGTSAATTTANGTGSFTFPGLQNGSYTVAVSLAGFVFTPASQPVTISGANASIIVSSVAQTYSLTGTISGPGGPGATVTLSGASAATTTANGTGSFTFSGLQNGSYTVAAGLAGFVFTPASQPVTISGANASITVSSAVQTYSLSGTISGPGGPGATVVLSGASSATTTANGAGAFTFSGLLNGNYTVTPSAAGFVYTPTNRAVTISGANASTTFTSVVQTFSLGGTISGTGGNGATVTVTGTSTASVTANASGAYSFAALPTGSYTVTPVKTGFLYTPGSLAVNLTANSTANFTSAPSYSISGTITGAGGSGATVTVTGASTASVVANASGAYTISGLKAGSYVVTPTKTGSYVYTPTTRSVTITNANVTENFSSVQTFSISGTISGPGGSGATIRLTGASTSTTTANSTGSYAFTGLLAGSYTVTPSNTGFVMSPTSQAVTLSTANVTANFNSVVQTLTLSGTISGAGGKGATVSVTGTATATTTANASGVYSIPGLVAGTYTVTPSLPGYVYTPASQKVTITTANVTANFSSAVQTFTISGTVSGAGANGATVRLTGAATASTTTNSSGAYSFTGVANGSYTVTVTKTGYVYTPASQAVTVKGSSVTTNFTSVVQTYSITGTITGAGASGATVKLSGTATTTVTANTSGVYTFTGLGNGFYTVTPSKSGHKYSPTSQTTVVSGANVSGLNFSSN
jgi:hypothetical protein